LSDVRDLFNEYEDQAPLWLGKFATNVGDLNDLAPVIIPDFDPNLQWGPARWQTRDDVTLPRKGDACLIAFDNHRNPWVIAWWPFSGGPT